MYYCCCCFCRHQRFVSAFSCLLTAIFAQRCNCRRPLPLSLLLLPSVSRVPFLCLLFPCLSLSPSVPVCVSTTEVHDDAAAAPAAVTDYSSTGVSFTTHFVSGLVCSALCVECVRLNGYVSLCVYVCRSVCLSV